MIYQSKMMQTLRKNIGFISVFFSAIIVMSLLITTYVIKKSKFEGVTTAIFVESGLNSDLASGIAAQIGISMPNLKSGIFNYYNFSEVLLSRRVFENAIHRDSVLLTKLAKSYGFKGLPMKSSDEDSLVGLIHLKVRKDISVDKVSKQSSVFTIRLKSTDKQLLTKLPEALIYSSNEFFLINSSNSRSQNMEVLKSKIDSVSFEITKGIEVVGNKSDELYSVNSKSKFDLQDKIARKLSANYSLLTELKKQYEIIDVSSTQDLESQRILVISTPQSPYREQYWRFKIYLKSFLLAITAGVGFVLLTSFLKSKYEN